MDSLNMFDWNVQTMGFIKYKETGTTLLVTNGNIREGLKPLHDIGIGVERLFHVSIRFWVHQSLDGVNFPTGLESIIFGLKFNQDIENVIFSED